MCEITAFFLYNVGKWVQFTCR